MASVKAPTAVLMTALIVATASPAFAQHLGRGADEDVAPLRIILALLLCIALAVGAAFAMRWKMHRAPGLARLLPAQRRIQLIERLRLSHQVDLCLVQCDGREYIITTSPRDTRIGPEIVKTHPLEEQPQQP